MLDLNRAARYLVTMLGRPIAWTGKYIVQKCAICDVELRLWDTDVRSYDALFRRLFSFYDAHRCIGLGCSVEEAYERADRESYRMAAQARALQDRELEPVGELPSLFERAEREAVALAAAAQLFEEQLRG